MAELNALIVAAIDFGTTYSGYAFSLRHDHEKDSSEIKIYTNYWKSGGQSLTSFKTPTTVLLDQNGKFDSFGYEDENKYSDLADDDEHEGWFYFRRFKMLLYKNKVLNRTTRIADINGQEKPAMEIFTHGIRYLKSELKKSLDLKGFKVKDSEIHWVLTVPAIWNDSAKQFMREAAQDAGIDGAQLTIALEPEAASMFCKHLPVEKLGAGEGIRPFAPGSRYLVLDAGGGTVDITVHEVKKNGCLKELHKASGGDWGGTKVDEQYRAMLTSFFKENSMEQFCQKYTAEFVDLYREFETKKRSLTAENIDKKISNKIPVVLRETFEENNDDEDVNDAISRSPFRGEIRWVRDKLQISSNVFAGLFDKACDNTVEHVKKLLQLDNVRGVDTIIMVGGFSECFILQKKVRDAFPNLKVIIPQDAGLAVLKGAVLFGWNPSSIASRIAKYTYGVATTTKFDPQKHDASKRMEVNGKAKCSDIFDIHVKKGDELVVGETQAAQTYTPLRKDQTSMKFRVYTSSKLDPLYVTDFGCNLVGSMTVKTPDTKGGLSREVKVQMIFGGTEIKMEAIEINTGKLTVAEFDFLEK